MIHFCLNSILVRGWLWNYFFALLLLTLIIRPVTQQISNTINQQKRRSSFSTFGLCEDEVEQKRTEENVKFIVVQHWVRIQLPETPSQGYGGHLGIRKFPNIYVRQQVWTAGRPVHHLEPCCCGLALCYWNKQNLPLKRRHLDGSICWWCQLTHAMCTNAPHTITDAGFWAVSFCWYYIPAKGNRDGPSPF